MTVELMVSKIVQARYVDLNDFDGYCVPGRVVLKTVSPVPVSALPDADLEQYGHGCAAGTARLHPKKAFRLFGGHDPVRGERITVEACVNHRNRGMRRGGTFQMSSLRRQGADE